MKSLEESARQILSNYVNDSHNGSITSAAEFLGLPYITLKQWIDGKRIPRLDALSPVFEKLGITFTSPKSTSSKDVQFIQAHVIDVNHSETPPHAEDYVAAPILGEVGAGPGIVPEEELQGWFMVHRSVIGGRGLHNLVAVEIAARSVSMRPTLNPGDVVLVDKDDISITRDGNIMLVRDPVDHSGMIKRVSIREDKTDARITFYSDNASQYPPLVYSLMEDFGGEWDKAIVGKVIWAWTDMRGK